MLIMGSLLRVTINDNKPISHSWENKVAPKVSEAAATSCVQHMTYWYGSECKEQRYSTQYTWYQQRHHLAGSRHPLLAPTHSPQQTLQGAQLMKIGFLWSRPCGSSCISAHCLAWPLLHSCHAKAVVSSEQSSSSAGKILRRIYNGYVLASFLMTVVLNQASHFHPNTIT